MLDICLSDIPKQFIREGKNGKKYLSARLVGRKEPDSRGNDYALAVNVPKEQRVEGQSFFFGAGKTYEAKAEAKPAYQAPKPKDNDDDPLPF